MAYNNLKSNLRLICNNLKVAFGLHNKVWLSRISLKKFDYENTKMKINRIGSYDW